MKEKTITQKKIIGALSLLIFLLISFMIFYFIGPPIIKFVSVTENFRAWVDSKGIFGRLAFIGMIIVQVIVAVIPGEPFEICAGYAFGALEGTLLCIIGSTIGSTIVFLFVRLFGKKVVELFFDEEKIDSLKFLQKTKELTMTVFIIFLIPGTPKDLLCYFVGLTKIKFSSWLFISATARIPSIITSTIGGNALGTEKYIFAIVVFAITLIISGAGLLLYNYICRFKEKGEKIQNGNN